MVLRCRVQINVSPALLAAVVRLNAWSEVVPCNSEILDPDWEDGSCNCYTSIAEDPKYISSFRHPDAQAQVFLIGTDLFRKPSWEILLKQVWVVALGDVGVAPKHDTYVRVIHPMVQNSCCRRAALRLT